ncbi:hypothetical protein BYT27DRAFT_6443874 [Phlegmacium glaucopus]|nr:hypothetical protein BYT27DRAFT_6443874 [Phlegmacium glaucopus]
MQSDDRVTPKKVGNKRRNNICTGKKKRNSAPSAVSLHKDQLGLQKSGAIDITFTNESTQPPDTSQSHPTLLRKDQHQKHHANSTSPYMSKQFEIGLSPIFEDTHTFANTLRSSNRVEIKPATTDTVDSSGSSYGELIQNKVRLSPSRSLPEHILVIFCRRCRIKLSNNLNLKARRGMVLLFRVIIMHAYTYELMVLVIDHRLS